MRSDDELREAAEENRQAGGSYAAIIYDATPTLAGHVRFALAFSDRPAEVRMMRPPAAIAYYDDLIAAFSMCPGIDKSRLRAARANFAEEMQAAIREIERRQAVERGEAG